MNVRKSEVSLGGDVTVVQLQKALIQIIGMENTKWITPAEILMMILMLLTHNV